MTDTLESPALEDAPAPNTDDTASISPKSRMGGGERGSMIRHGERKESREVRTQSETTSPEQELIKQ